MDDLVIMTPALQPTAPETADATPTPSPNDQWLDSSLTLRPELRFDCRNGSDNAYVVIEDPVRGKFFRIGVKEYRFVASLKGDKTVREIVGALEKEGGQVDEESAKTICQWLVNSNLVYGQGIDNAKRLDQQVEAISKQKLLGLLNPICFKVRLFNPNELLSNIQPYTQWVFSKWFLVAWILVGLVALRVMYCEWDQIGNASVGILSGFKWLWMLVIWVALKVVHEAAHGVACRRYGGEVPDAGVLILLFTPMAFVNVTTSWRFSNRWQRIVVAAAGMYVELFLACVSLIVWANLPDGVLADVCFNVFIMASVTTILFNANPLMRFDGYYMLSDFMGIPNLYPKGTKWFGDRLKHLFLGTKKTKSICAPNEQRRVAIYGSMAFFWKILISLSLTIGASVLFYGAGVALAVCGIGLFFGIPIYKQVKMCWGENAVQPVNKRRVTISMACLLAICFAMFTVLRGPATKSAPAIVQFKDEIPLRAEADGFLREILVSDGQRVSKGDALIKLDNPQLELEIHQLRCRAKESQIQVRIYQQTEETALAQAEDQNHQSLLEQLYEKQEQAKGLVLIAPYDGFVFKRGLENTLDSFVKRGDELINIAQGHTKEIIVSIDQSDLESIKGNEGQMLRVAFPGHRVFESRLIKIDPRANDTPSHPSLCANVGGPLPVHHSSDNSDDESSVQLLAPRFTADLAVASDYGTKLCSGQRGRAFFSAESQSLGSYLLVATSNWFEEKLEQATLTAVF